MRRLEGVGNFVTDFLASVLARSAGFKISEGNAEVRVFNHLVSYTYRDCIKLSSSETMRQSVPFGT